MRMQLHLRAHPPPPPPGTRASNGRRDAHFRTAWCVHQDPASFSNGANIVMANYAFNKPIQSRRYTIIFQAKIHHNLTMKHSHVHKQNVDKNKSNGCRARYSTPYAIECAISKGIKPKMNYHEYKIIKTKIHVLEFPFFLQSRTFITDALLSNWNDLVFVE